MGFDLSYFPRPVRRRCSHRPVPIVFPVRTSPSCRPVPPQMLPPEAHFAATTPTVQSFICRLLLYFQASPFAIELAVATLKSVMLLLMGFDLFPSTRSTSVVAPSSPDRLPGTCFSWSAVVTTLGAPSKASSTTSRLLHRWYVFLLFPSFTWSVPCHAKSTLYPSAGNTLKRVPRQNAHQLRRALHLHSPRSG